MRRIFITTVLVIATCAALVVPSAGATPTAPTEPPYDGCSDWYVQTWYPMSEADQQWVFRCEAGDISWEDGTGWWGYSDYYWNAEWSTITWFAWQSVNLDEGWGFGCVFYPEPGACGD
jgi:hypothetical protein